MQTPSTPMPSTAEGFKNLPIGELYVLQEVAKSGLAEAKSFVSLLSASIMLRFMPAVAIAYNLAEKEHGTVRVDLPDGYQVKADITRTVVWDQAALKKIAQDMDWEEIQHYFKIKFDVPSAVYDGIAPGSGLKGEFTVARTVKFGAPKVVIEAPKS